MQKKEASSGSSKQEATYLQVPVLFRKNLFTSEVLMVTFTVWMQNSAKKSGNLKQEAGPPPTPAPRKVSFISDAATTNSTA